MDMQNVSNLQISEGAVRTIHDKNNRLIWGRLAYDTKYVGNSEQRNLPSEYQQVEYLESSDGARMLLDYYLKGITEIDIKVQHTGSSTKSIGVMGNDTQPGTGSVSNPKYMFTTSSTGNTLGCYYYTNSFAVFSPSLNIESALFRLRTKIENGNFNIYINDEETPRRTIPAEDFICVQKTTLFGVAAKDRFKNQKVYYARFYENNVKVVDLIPCYRKSDNVPGMYDTVTGTFYTNYGTSGEFIVGPDVTVPTPETPIIVRTVTGRQVVTVTGGDDESAEYEIDLGDIELCKIGTYQDYIYQSEGDWYVHKATGKMVLDGTESWSNGGNWWGSGRANYGMYCYFTDLAKIGAETTYNHALLCNDFSEPETGLSLRGGVNEGIKQNGGTGQQYIALAVAQTRLADVTSQALTLSSLRNWLSTNKPIVYHTLDTPTDTKITDATLVGQLNDVHEWLTRYGYSSTVFGDLPIVLQRDSLQ